MARSSPAKTAFLSFITLAILSLTLTIALPLVINESYYRNKDIGTELNAPPGKIVNITGEATHIMKIF